MEKKLKSETTYRFNQVIESVNADEIEIKKHKSSYNEYDINGNLIKDISYNNDESINQMFVYKYNEDGYKQEEQLYYDEDEIADRKTFETDKNGKTINAYNHYTDGSKDIIKHTYDENNNLTEILLVDDDGDIEEKQIYIYENGKITLKEITNENNETIIKEECKYNEKGDEIERTSFDAENKSFTKTQFIFNDNNEWSKILKHDREGILIEKSTYNYNDKGRLIELISESPQRKTRMEFKEDDNENIIEQIEYNDNNEINYKLNRTFAANGTLDEVKIFIDMHGAGINQNYTNKYEYEYFD